MEICLACLGQRHCSSPPSRGFINKDIIRENEFPLDGAEESVIFLCRPPAMIQKAVLSALKDWGYEGGKDCFRFCLVSCPIRQA